MRPRPLLATTFLLYNGATGRNCAVPVYRAAAGRWGATVSTPFGDATYISPFGHCR